MVNKTNQLKTMIRDGPVSASAIRAAGIPSGVTSAQVRQGGAIRLSRGVYAAAEADYSETTDYEVLALAVPRGVFCLLSALRLHGLTDENPHGLCLALQHGYHAPAVSQPPATFIFRTEPLFSSNIETRISHGVAIRVYGLEQTLADCFQYRNKIGLDVAVAALREAFEGNRVDRNRLWQAVRLCRATRVMRPYLEAFS